MTEEKQTVSQTLSQALEERKFTTKTPVEKSKIYLTIHGENVIGTSGNFVAFVGLPKTSKSTFIAFCISSAITGDPHAHIKAHLYPKDGKNRIALFDTEQTPYDFDRKAKMIQRMTGKQDIFKNFDAYLLNDCSPRQIMQMIRVYLEKTPGCGILVIDGLLDCIDNMNDESQSKRLIRTIKKTAKQFDCLIITVLHLSKKDRMSLGHLGSASDRAAQSVIEIDKVKEGNIISYSMKPKLLRSSADFDEIRIIYDEEKKLYVLYDADYWYEDNKKAAEQIRKGKAAKMYIQK